MTTKLLGQSKVKKPKPSPYKQGDYVVLINPILYQLEIINPSWDDNIFGRSKIKKTKYKGKNKVGDVFQVIGSYNIGCEGVLNLRTGERGVIGLSDLKLYK